MAINPMALVPVITAMCRTIEPVTNRGGGSDSEKAEGLEVGIGPCFRVIAALGKNKNLAGSGLRRQNRQLRAHTRRCANL